MSRSFLLIVCVLGVCLVGFSQEQAASPNAASDQKPEGTAVSEPAGTSQENSAPAAPSTSEKDNPKGDKIVLKSGGVLEGLQIVRETPTYYEVEVVEGSVTMRIPRRQVESVEYDDYDPAQAQKKSSEAAPAKNEPLLLPGHEMPSQFLKDISDPPLKYEQQDFITILEEVGRRAQASITIDESIRAFPEAQRAWTFESKPGTTAAAVLESLTSSFDYLRVVYERGGAVVLAKTTPPPAQPAAPSDSTQAAPGQTETVTPAGSQESQTPQQ